MTRMWFSLFLITSLPWLGLTQGGNAVNYNALIQQLESEVSKGNLIALRDLGTLLDKKSVGEQAKQILKTYTFFLDNEFKWKETTNRKHFLNFFYTNKNNIRFFHPAEIFYISALEIEKVEYQIEALPKNVKVQKTVDLRKRINVFEKFVNLKEDKKVDRALQAIIDIDSRESRHYLLQILQEQMIQQSQLKGKINLIIKICEALQYHASMEILQEVLISIHNGFLPFENAKSILAHLTNHSLAEMTDAQEGIEYFGNLIDSLETMEDIRYAGYENVFDFNKYIFPHEVDYYGRIVGLTDDYPWMKRNAILDMMQTEHGRSYLYLASDFYRNHLAPQEAISKVAIPRKEYAKFFIESNHLIIKVLDSNKSFRNIFDTSKNKKEEDEVLTKNFLLYWMTHHLDFEWSPSYAMFINKFEILAKTENYEKLFRRLNSSNNVVAMESFIQLTEGTPAEIYNLSNKYRQLLRSYNKVVPNIQHLYLEQLSELTDFCRNNSITYHPTNRLKQKLDQLREKLSMTERYQLENKIIGSLELNEITAVEYYSCLFEKNNEFTYSIGRILDHVYSQHWSSIINNDSHLRLYLKKAAIFKRIGTIGSCNSYLNKLETNSVILNNRLKELLEVEPDDDIIFLIEFLSPEEVVEESSDLDEFIENPTDFSKNDVRVLPVATKEEIQEIVDRMKEETDKKVLKKYLEYLRKDPQIEATPIYFQLIDNQTVVAKKYGDPYTVGDLIVPVLDGAFNHHFTPEEKGKRFATSTWKKLWEEDGENYKKWTDLFFEQKLKQLHFADKLKIKVINDIFLSENYQPKYFNDCLEALKKVRPYKDVKKLKAPEKLSVKTQLKYFEDFQFSYKDLDDIPKLFDIDDAEMMFDYLQKRTIEFDEIDLGTFWNNIFRQSWFVEFINSKNNRTAELQNIKKALEIYLNESDLISEYEEQITNLNISQIESMRLSFIEKLNNSIQSQKDPTTKALIQQSILARANYRDLAKIIAILDQLSTNENFQPLLFLQKDFGLPIFGLEDELIRNQVVKNHRKMSEYDFYKLYLKAFGVNFLTRRGNLDYQKIYDLLQYEIVTPFVGGGGGHRDQFTYGLIKVLELHFKDKLGFHEKLNENQTFYTFTSTKRAQAWRNYLRDKRLVTENKEMPPSFNDIVNNQ